MKNVIAHNCLRLVQKIFKMASKRKFPLDEDEDHQEIHVSNKKHTLDSDEEDSDEYEKDDLHDSDIEGEEDGTAATRDEVKITPFNMREELQEGHFDKDGTYHWDKNADVRDNWLDNIDWVKVKEDKSYLDPNRTEESNELPTAFNEAQAYDALLAFMEPKETIQKTLQRLGKSRVKISSAERLRRKKLGIVDEAAEKITKFTELTNEILTKTGNMDIYQTTTEQIRAKVNSFPSTSKGAQSAKAAKSWSDDLFDMYADDFDEKEKQRIETAKTEEKTKDSEENKVEPQNTVVRWEFKWKQDDTELQGPYTTEQMQKWAEEKYFKSGVYVRKVGEETNFYTSNRIDFELYL